MDLRLAVTPKGYDDIGAVIRGLGYAFVQISEGDLTSASKLSKFDVIFINCRMFNFLRAQGAAATLSHYVSGGGTIYASDYASAYISSAFPDAIEFAGKRGRRAKATTRVVDKGLRALVGDALELHFDKPGWEQIKAVSQQARVYLQLEDQPILVSFAHGKGQVFYTCFHNHAQASQQEIALLRYLVIKPLMARASSEIVDLSWAEKKALQETPGTVSPSQLAPWYSYGFAQGGDLMAALNWKGTARLSLEIEGSGQRWQQTGDSAPLKLVIHALPAGTYRYRVTAQQVPINNFPFVVLIGPAAQVGQSPGFTPPAATWQDMAAAQAVDPEILSAIKIFDSQGNVNQDELNIRILDEQ